MSKKIYSVFIAAILLFCLILSANAEKKVFLAPELNKLDTSKDLMHLYVLDLLGADCMLLSFKGENMLIDSGKENQYGQLKTMLDKLNIKELTVFNTHPHKDHIGGVVPLADDYNIKRFYTAFSEYEKGQKAAVEKLASQGKEMTRVYPNDKLPFHSDIYIKVLQNKYGQNLNEQSAMLKIQYNKAKLLLTADISAGSQRYFTDKLGETMDADILKIPHHGIENIKTDFLSCVGPEFCFFTHGSGDTQKVQIKLDKRNIPYFFATHGIIHLVTDGETWFVEQLSKTAP